MNRLLLAAVLALVSAAASADDTHITPFSAANAGAQLPGAWKPLGLPHAKMPEFLLVQDGGVIVMQVLGESAAGTISHPLDADPRKFSLLKWRWKVNRVVGAADMMTRSHEDFAARVYVFFDVPSEKLPLGTRAKLRLGALLYGAELPTATICYVWDNTHPVGTHAPSPFTDTVHTWVVQSGNAQANEWTTEAHNLEADFRAAFGHFWKGPVPRVKGIAIGLDTDQTKESVTATFGDFGLGEKP
jgi:Protein of unknown function (DUF3047)